MMMLTKKGIDVRSITMIHILEIFFEIDISGDVVNHNEWYEVKKKVLEFWDVTIFQLT